MLFRSKPKGCAVIQQLVDERIKVFFPDKVSRIDIAASLVGRKGDYEPQQLIDQYHLRANVLETATLSVADVYVLYFPSMWMQGYEVIDKIKQTITDNGVVIILDISQDKYGHHMCRWGDILKTHWGAQCVLDHCAYTGEISLLLSKHLMIAQLWGKQVSGIHLDQLVTY